MVAAQRRHRPGPVRPRASREVPGAQPNADTATRVPIYASCLCLCLQTGSTAKCVPWAKADLGGSIIIPTMGVKTSLRLSSSSRIGTDHA